MFSQNQEKHLQHVRYVLDQLRKHGLKANTKKTSFCLDHIEYLGHIVQNGTVCAGPSKVVAKAAWPVPQDIMQLQSFLGLANYYNRFIQRFAYIATPLTSLLQKNVPFVWGPQQDAALNELKVLLTTTPILKVPNFEYDFLLETDTSAFVISVALMQDKGDGLQPVAHFSKKLSDTIIQYAPHKVELLAIVASFEKFRPYVECRHTTVKPDHRPLIHVKTQPYLSNHQIRWTQKLSQYNYAVKYKKGITNVAADMLSRHPDLQGKKLKFVHFSDQRGFPLVQQHVFSETDVGMRLFEDLEKGYRG